ncbi:MAG TPA: dephospho-CoA kinase [Syntrophus sp. (in: bacteria)]|jgi:dephospho-CoA kinase|nr:dephospho-CoA kinase [Syntrophus sp. (in: bacteria)]
MLNVGLTGGIASGKSTVAAMLVEKGAFHIDFDILAHGMEKPEMPVWRAIIDAFGPEILNEDGTINRTGLGAIVFADQDKMAQLNAIVHPAVFTAWRRQLEEIKEEKADAIVLSDVPLLIEAGMKQMVDVVLLVYISPEEQLRRLMARNGYTREEALSRLNAQMPIQDKLSLADLIVNNEGSHEETQEQVVALWGELIRRERAK